MKELLEEVTAASLHETIRRRALAYLSRYVGDATTVGEVEPHDGGWAVPVYLSYADHRLGTLVFSGEGELSLAKSTSPELMQQVATTP